MSWPTATSTTTDTSRSLLVFVQQDEDGSWIVSDNGTTVYGHGDSLLEALIDWWTAHRSTVAVLEDKELAPQIAREDRVSRWLLGKEPHV